MQFFNGAVQNKQFLHWNQVEYFYEKNWFYVLEKWVANQPFRDMKFLYMVRQEILAKNIPHCVEIEIITFNVVLLIYCTD